MSLDKTWHLATSTDEIKFTEFELLLWRVNAAFYRWQEECEKIANDDELSADELAVLHILRMHDRSKSIADVGRLLNRDNFFGINYNINKLVKLGLVRKVAGKKQHQYEVTEAGKKNTDAYTEARRNILIAEFRKYLNNIKLEELTEGLMQLKGIYEEAMRVASASTYTPVINNSNPDKPHKPHKKKK